MTATPDPTRPAAEQLVSLAMRTLWILYGGFWFSILIYVGIMVALPFLGEGGAAPIELPDNWAEWEFLFVAVGLVCLYLTHRLGNILLNRNRLWRGTTTIWELAALLERKKSPGGAGSPGQVEDPSTGSRQQSLARAVQHLLGRILTAHVFLWVLAELPALLGLVDRFLSGSWKIAAWLLLISALILLVPRPSRRRIEALLEPLLREPELPMPPNGRRP